MDMKTMNQRKADQMQRARAGQSPEHPETHVEWPLESRTEKDALASKLALEIEQLEAWLANQQTAQQGSISVIPTIKSLIHTRKKLLKNIQSPVE